MTGVQTCALPICVPVAAIAARAFPFALAMVGVSALIGFVPQISLFLLSK